MYCGARVASCKDHTTECKSRQERERQMSECHGQAQGRETKCRCREDETGFVMITQKLLRDSASDEKTKGWYCLRWNGYKWVGARKGNQNHILEP